jgi:hypothetical protein
MALSLMALAGMDPLRTVTSRNLTQAAHGSGTIFQPPAVVAGLDNVAMTRQAVEQRGRHLGVTDYLMMPLMLTGESLRSGSLIRITRFMAVACRSAIAARDAVLV